MPKRFDYKPEIQKSLEILVIETQKQNSFTRVFIKGVVAGVGSALGATFVAGLLLVIISQLITSINDLPILNQLIPANQLNQFTPSDTN